MTQIAGTARTVQSIPTLPRAASKTSDFNVDGSTKPSATLRVVGESDLRVLPRDDFLRDMTREKRRAERSRRPLSLVLLNVNPDRVWEPKHTSRLTDLLHINTRETDIIGHVDEQAIAVLCPDTELAGAQQLMKKINLLAEHLPYKITAATYPDAVFDQLASGRTSAPALRDLVESEFVGDEREIYLFKRTVDVVGALIALVFLAPVLLLAMMAVALTSRGTVIFTQERIGKAGVPFKFYKLRSMVALNDDSSHREFVARLIQNPGGQLPSDAGGAAPYKMNGDARVTPVGRFIRKTSIDELPQLFNVLKGDMSLVGPRPPIAYETVHYQAWHLRRILTIKPGITGLWQVSGRSRVSFNAMVRLDLQYIRDCSLRLDLKILWRTVAVVLLCRGSV